MSAFVGLVIILFNPYPEGTPKNSDGSCLFQWCDHFFALPALPS